MITTPDNIKIHFGAKDMEDYTIHKDIERAKLYVQRHIKREE